MKKIFFQLLAVFKKQRLSFFTWKVRHENIILY